MIFFYFVTASDPLGNGDSIWLDSANVAIFTEISSIFNKKYFSIVFFARWFDEGGGVGWLGR